jgi:hypothetical protein
MREHAASLPGATPTQQDIKESITPSRCRCLVTELAAIRSSSTASGSPPTGFEVEVEALNADPTLIERVTVPAVVDSLEAIIGHSAGGVFTEGVKRIPLSQVRASVSSTTTTGARRCCSSPAALTT